ncbi:MAG: MmcQ/YjbR family DNA-binding protein, partial [Spirochaetaceae bacterium]|nr:MmcQ/YjbR family DNA-binding protein [Spirochaetaceae bacterium]
MTRDETRTYLLSRKGAWEDYPFDNVTPVYKVGKKMFALIRTESPPLQINLKCDPELARDLRDVYEDITPGYHMNKKHWNTINCQGNLPDSEI